VIAESLLDADMLAGHVAAILTAPGVALQMSRAAMSVARPDAAQRLADLVEELKKD
jgi:UDP-N-acetylglucosamine--N-acetylmuramyl-(pentapeptide) pyrophosphoryl-undecaprenol N-acetylglucosamine transferase